MSDLNPRITRVDANRQNESTDGDSNDDVFGCFFDFVIPSSLVLRHFHHQYSRQFA